MSCWIQITQLSKYFNQTQIKDLEKQLCIVVDVEKNHGRKPSFWNNSNSRTCTVWVVQQVNKINGICVPFHWLSQFYTILFDECRPIREDCRVISKTLSCTITLRPLQLELIQEVQDCWKRQRGTALLAVYPGCGKTMMSCSLIRKVRLRTIILVHRIVLIHQWKDTLERMYQTDMNTLRVQCVLAGQTLQSDVDVYIINIVNVPKFSFEEWKTLQIGFVIVDECHLLVTRQFVQSLSYFTPRYLLGLSATPYRKDGLHKLLDYYFGSNHIFRPLYCQHSVYWISTNFIPTSTMDKQGQLDWNSVLTSQSNCTSRNHAIVEWMMRHKHERNGILVLCKRTDQIQQLQHLLLRNHCPDEEKTTFMGNQKSFSKDAKILLATFQKVGVGFSHDKMDTLILACDVEDYFLQYLGRVFRHPDTKPLILDIVDQHAVLKRHFLTRKKIYQQVGGTIHRFQWTF